MIFILIAVAWLTVLAIVVNACRSAARGDQMLAESLSSSPRHAGARVARAAFWGEGPALVGAHRLDRVHPATRSGSRTIRARGERCAAGS
jgi:hypothetical protein